MYIREDDMNTIISITQSDESELGLTPDTIHMVWNDNDEISSLPKDLWKLLTVLHAMGYPYVDTLIAVKSDGTEVAPEDV